MRGFSCLFRIERAYAILHVITASLEPLRPYINLYMTAVILNELSGGKNVRLLLLYALATVALNLLLSVLLHILNLRKGHHNNQFFKNEKMMFAEKSMSMDYEKIEDAGVRELLGRIRNESQNGYNMFFLTMFSGQLIGSAVSLFTAATLCLGLFMDGKIAVWARMAAGAGILLAVLVNYIAAQRGNQLNLEMFESLVPYNVKFNFYNEYFEDYNAGKDIRLYGLDGYIAEMQTDQKRLLKETVWRAKRKSLQYVLAGSAVSDLVSIIAYGTAVFGCLNGSGKTTMIKLLCRLYSPTEGSILLNGVDINEYEHECYRKKLAAVFQDFKVFSFSLGLNIAVCDHYGQEEVLEAAGKAGLESLIRKLPQGLEAPLYKDFEDGGIELSGGEAQKVALARAIYKKAPVIVLDEPTAARDPVAENDIYEKFHAIAGDKTVIFISHRMAACTFCDIVYVFEKGEIIQRGPHKELVSAVGGRYYELWNAQANPGGGCV